MEKRFKPSRKRLDKALKDGNLPKSQYLSQAVVAFSGTTVSLLFWQNSWVEDRMLLEYTWTSGLTHPYEMLHAYSLRFFVSVLTVLSFVAVAALAVEFIQLRSLLRIQLPVFKLERLDAVNGFTKIFVSLKRVWQIVLRLFALLLIFFWFSRRLSQSLEGLFMLAREALEELLLRWIWQLTLSAGLLLLISGVLDLIIRRRQWFQSVGMSFDEMRQENKEEEGDPHIKSYRRTQHEALLREDLIRRVRRSKVIVVEKN